LIEEGVLEEAEFYNMNTLIGLVKERIRERDQKKLENVDEILYSLIKTEFVVQFRNRPVVSIEYFNVKKKKLHSLCHH
jgi:hypothetical protein